jgi:hypothetical protein
MIKCPTYLLHFDAKSFPINSNLKMTLQPAIRLLTNASELSISSCRPARTQRLVFLFKGRMAVICQPVSADIYTAMAAVMAATISGATALSKTICW